MKSKSLGPAPRRRVRLMVAALLALAALFAPGSALADFTASPTSGFAPLTVTFTDTTSATPNSTWNFGDNTTPINANPTTHVYQAAGTYTVTLTSSDGVNPPQTLTGSVTVLPAPPGSGFTTKAASSTTAPHGVAFTDRSTGGATAWQWNFGDAPPGTVQSIAKNPTHAYALPGSYTVTLTACNSGGCDATPAQVSAVMPPNRAPTAAFDIFSSPTGRGTQVAFDGSKSGDPDGDPITYSWDLDKGAFDPLVSGVTASTVFNTLGDHLVRLQVSDGGVERPTVSHTVKVVGPPQPGFSFTPTSPIIGQNVVFTSSFTDPDGQVKRLDWDLDGDGQFDDAAGSVAQWTYFTPGMRVVALKATDDKDVYAIAAQTVTVTAPPSSTPAGSPPAPASSSGVPRTKRVLLSPFPIIRMRARIIGSIIHIDLLSVKAPSGATVQVRCKGRRCPVSRERERVRKGARSVRFHKLERRLRAGTVLEIFVTKGGAIGKYTRFAFRAGKAPSRRDLCLPYGSMRPGRCPVP